MHHYTRCKHLSRERGREREREVRKGEGEIGGGRERQGEGGREREREREIHHLFMASIIRNPKFHGKKKSKKNSIERTHLTQQIK